MMRILINDIAATPDTGGAFTILSELYAGAKENLDNIEWIFLTGDTHFKSAKNIRVIPYPDIKKSWIKRLWFDLFSGKFLINKLRPDVYISMQNTATLGVLAKQIVYLHQSLPYQKTKRYSFFKKSEFKYAIYQNIIGYIINFLLKKTKASVIVQTKWMQKNLMEKHVVEEDKIEVIPPSIPSDLIKIGKNNNIMRTFFFPASSELYKNHKVIYQAVNRLKEKGYKDFSVILTINQPDYISKEDYPEIIFSGYIPRNKVLDEYTKSVLLFPSYIETFGLPLLEARLAQSIIIAADTEFAKEILTQYTNSYFFNYWDHKKLADLMAKVLDNKIRKSRIVTNSSGRVTHMNLVSYLISRTKG